MNINQRTEAVDLCGKIKGGTQRYTEENTDLHREKAKRLRFILCFLPYVLCLIPYMSHAQDLSNVDKAKPVTIDGGISATQVYYDADQHSSYRKPYSYTVSANLNVAVFGWSIPISAVYSNNRWSYQQPFNQFTLSPTYKWIQTHIGYSSMSFSPYTLNGHQFLGGGVDLTPPGNFKVSLMAGRMQKRVLPDTTGLVEPAYYRFGSGLKTEYTFNGGAVSLSTFYGRDNKSSLSGFEDSTLAIRPQENLCYSLAGNINKIKNVNFAFEIGQSLISEDTHAEILDGKSTFVPGFAYRTSTHRYTAYKLNSGLNTIIGTIGVGYERIDPGYKTLGAYYSNNDFENFTFNYAGRAFKDKVTLSLSTGLQRDDLDGTKHQQNKRVVSNASMGLNLTKKLNLGLNYSNFTSYTNIKTAFDNINNTSPYGKLDTLDFTQLTENYGGMVNYSPGSGEKLHNNLMFSLNYQRAADKQSDNPSQSGAKFYNSMAGYNVSFVKLGLTMGLTVNYNRNVDTSLMSEIFGPTFSARKTLFDKKMNASLGISYNESLTYGKIQSDVYVTRAGMGYVLHKKHNFDLNGIYALRQDHVKSEKHYELTVTLTYRYNFGIGKGKQNDKSKSKPAEQPVQSQGQSYSPE